MMIRFPFKKLFVALVLAVLMASAGIAAEPDLPLRSREVSDIDGVPVLTKHLPGYESVADRATYILNPAQLTAALGDRPVLALIDFAGGTEAVTAEYPAGRLLIVEFTTPQLATEADTRIRGFLETRADIGTVYRRIGNYSAFVFDTNDAAAANALLDEIKFEKEIRWLGNDPFALKRAERAFVLQTSDLFITTVLIVIGGIALSGLAGLIVGYIVFLFREQKRAGMTAYSDAGGMTRLNLDGFTPEAAPDRLIGE